MRRWGGIRAPRSPRPLRAPLSLRGAACALLLGAFVFSAQAASLDSSSEEGPASPLVRSAQDFAAQGRWDAAASLLAEAEAVDGRDSDVRYLSALVLLKSKDDAAAALAELDAASLSKKFFLYSSEDALNLKASLLIRMRRFEEALALAAPPGRLSGAQGSVAPAEYGLERRLAAAQALYGLGKRDAAFNEIAEAARLFPAEPRLARLFFKEAAGAPETDAIRDLGTLFLRRLPSLAEADPDLRVLAAPFIPDEGARRDSILAYRAMGGSSSQASLRALEYGIIDDSACVAELFSGKSLLLSDLFSLRSLLRDKKGEAALDTALTAYSGTIAADRDADGFAEETAVYEKGLLRSYSLDGDQDGRPELQVSAREGIPASLKLSRAGLSLEASYSRYPYVDSLRFFSGGGAREYRFGPEAFIYAPLSLEAFPSGADDRIYLPAPSQASDPSERSAAAAALSLRAQNGEYQDFVTFDAGIPLRRERYLGGRLYGALDYKDGQPGLERLDVDGDGRFETERVYDPAGDGSDASIRSLRVDSDGDGVFEYREETAFPHLKEWDFDGDGLVDARQTSLAQGGARREFSSRLDGRFDETLVVDGKGRIVSFERAGKPLRLIADKNPRLRWIGRKPLDLGGNLPSAEGLYRYKNLRYRLVYSGDDAFAEPIP